MTSNVADFYKNARVFITGGTGFLGIAIIEKLLRCCPEVGKIYLLVRSKKGKSIETRIEDLIKNPIFERLIEEKSGSVFTKLEAVAGDVGQENLGLSNSDRQKLVENVNVVIHSAATLDFNETLRPTVNINLLGTRRIMELCQQIKKLKAVVHVSSAYVNSYLLETEEILYPAPTDAEKLIELVNKSSDEELEKITPTILKDHPNTYTITKHLAEHEVNKCVAKLNAGVGIVRPSMITAAWHEPVPGWTNSKNGPQGFLMGASKGVVRRLPVGKSTIYDYIPVDVVVNEILVTAWHVFENRDGKLKIFHATSSTTNPFRWESVADNIPYYLHQHPMRSAIWYPNLKFHSSLLMYKISAIFLHFLPAIFLDLLLKITGGRPILIRLHKNIWNSLNLLEKFIFTEWKYHNKKTLELSSQLSDKDKEVFFIDMSTLKWNDYFENLAKGVLRYLNNEHPRHLEAAKKKDKMLFVVHIAFQVLFHCLMWWLVSCFVGISMSKIPFVVPVSYALFSLL
ncbi:putative fatty acyl-CoA reductase CG8306 [Culicoides brevitarsis]|uniref:putative fatty acyl-CoA reductase CG8306 n=1 Tax=Culicoides brevitarsis TaxID=469753 RepID=UPI00307C4CDD